MNINKSDEKGAISLFVLLSMMFFLAFIVGTYSIVTRRSAAQGETINDTQKIYSQAMSASDKYNLFFSKTTGNVTPIYTIEQLKRALDGAGYYLDNGTFYKYSADTYYVLESDIILDLEDTINGKNGLQDILYDYVLYDDTYNINPNGYSIYYQKNDGSFWKLVCYQNIGTADNPQLFNTVPSNTYYSLKSYHKERFSILGEGIDGYSNAWDYDNSFEFMLMYSVLKDSNLKFNTDIYNRWRQTKNPIKDVITVSSDVSGDSGSSGGSSSSGSMVGSGITGSSSGSETSATSDSSDEDSDVSNDEVLVATGYTTDFTESSLGLGTTNYWGGLVQTPDIDSELKICEINGSVGKDECYYAVAVCEYGNDYGIPISDGIVSNGNSSSSTSNECLLFVRYK